MLILSCVALYLLYRLARRSGPSGSGRVLPIVLESSALVLLVMWRTVSAVSRTRW